MAKPSRLPHLLLRESHRVGNIEGQPAGKAGLNSKYEKVTSNVKYFHIYFKKDSSFNGFLTLRAKNICIMAYYAEFCIGKVLFY